MKKTIIITSVLIMLSSIGFAQGFHLGIKAGANINKLTGEPFSQQFTYGYHVGAYAEIKLGSKWSIEPDVLFNQVNVDTATSFSAVYQFKNLGNVQLKYLSIPIVLQYKLSNVLSLQGGAQYGILMNQSENLVQNGKDAFTNGDVSLVGGVQVKLGSFHIYGRYISGLSNINNTGTTDMWKGQTIQLGVGFSIL